MLNEPLSVIDSEPEPAGSASNTGGGTVKDPALSGAVQIKVPLAVLPVAASDEDELPLIVTVTPGAPPLQVTVVP